MSKTTEALKLALETAEAIVAANWKTWEELATPEEFERWAKSRANHMVAVIREARAEQERQEPVAWPIDRNWFYSVLRYAENNPDYFDDVAPDCISLESNEADTVIDALNAASVSAKREWVDLTDDELKAALDALENLITYDYHGNPDNGRDIAGAEAIAALRQAISVAEQPSNMNLNCKSVQARLASLWGYVKEQPVEQWESLKDPQTLFVNLNRGFPAQLTAQHLHHLLNNVEQPVEQKQIGWWDGKETAFFEHELSGLKAPAEFSIQLYTRPAPRTEWVDLTDDEIEVYEMMGGKSDGMLARAVIAAFKEKNK